MQKTTALCCNSSPQCGKPCPRSSEAIRLCIGSGTQCQVTDADSRRWCSRICITCPESPSHGSHHPHLHRDERCITWQASNALSIFEYEVPPESWRSRASSLYVGQGVRSMNLPMMLSHEHPSRIIFYSSVLSLPWHPTSCLFLLLRTLNAFLHPTREHLNGFSPVCE